MGGNLGVFALRPDLVNTTESFSGAGGYHKSQFSLFLRLFTLAKIQCFLLAKALGVPSDRQTPGSLSRWSPPGGRLQKTQSLVGFEAVEV